MAVSSLHHRGIVPNLVRHLTSSRLLPSLRFPLPPYHHPTTEPPNHPPSQPQPSPNPSPPAGPLPTLALRHWLDSITDTSPTMGPESDLAHLPALMRTGYRSMILDVLARRLREPYPSNLKALDAASWIEGRDLRGVRGEVKRLVGRGRGEVGRVAGVVLEEIERR